ncbi:putative reverse transcriptase domain-containing protein, partial [Tanacetum coccineum]
SYGLMKDENDAYVMNDVQSNEGKALVMAYGHGLKACNKATGACFTYRKVRHMAKDCKKGSTRNGGNENNKQPATKGRVFALATNRVTNATISSTLLNYALSISTPMGNNVLISHEYRSCSLHFDDKIRFANLLPLEMSILEIILSLEFLTEHRATIDCHTKRVIFGNLNNPEFIYHCSRPGKPIKIISAFKTLTLISNGCEGFLASLILKVSPCRVVRCFGIKGKLNPRFIGPFEILDKVGKVSYRLALPPQLSHVHNVFHVSLLRGYNYHPLHVVSYPLDQIREDLSFVEEPEDILDRQERKDDLNTYCVSNDDKDDFDVVTDTNVDHEEKTEGEVKSYANDVQKNDNNVDTSFEYKPTEISEDGTEFVIFDEEIVAKGSEKWKLTIRGQFVGCYMQGICYFKFQSNEGLERVLKQGPWIVNNKPLYVQKWNPIIGLEKVDAIKIPVWAKLINIQLEAWSKEGISALASSLRHTFEDGYNVYKHKFVFGHENEKCIKGQKDPTQNVTEERRKENNKDVREYQQKKVMENNKGRQANSQMICGMQLINLLTSIDEKHEQKEKNFRFANFIVDKKEFTPTVVKVWKEEVKGHHMYEVVQKIKRLKYHMKSLAWKNENLLMQQAKVDLEQ